MTTISQAQNTEQHFRPSWALSIALLAATFAAPFIKLTSQAGVDAPMIAAGRLLLAALILSPFVWKNHRSELQQISRRNLFLALSAGVWVATHFILLITALEYTSVMLNQVLLNTGPIWAAIFEMFLEKTRLHRLVWLGLLIAFGGGVFIALTSGEATAGASNPMLGNILAIIGAIAGTIYMILTRKARGRISLIPYNWLVFGCGGLIALGYAMISGINEFSQTPNAYFWLVMLTLLPQLVGHFGFNYALRHMQATFVSLIAQILTVSAAIAAFFIFGEIPTIWDVIGSAIIIIGVTIALNAPKIQADEALP